MPVLAPRKAKERRCFAVLLLRHLKSGKSRLSMPRSSLIALGCLRGSKAKTETGPLWSVFRFSFFLVVPSSPRRDGFQAHTAPHCCASPFLLPESSSPRSSTLTAHSCTDPSPDLAVLEETKYLVSRYFAFTKQNTLCKTNILWYAFTKEGRAGICGI